MTLRIIATGGTFDKHYNELTGQLVLGKSVLPFALERARLTQEIVFEHLFALDSLDMQDQHRQQIKKPALIQQKIALLLCTVPTLCVRQPMFWGTKSCLRQ